MDRDRETPERHVATQMKRKLEMEYQLLQKSAGNTMERFDYDNWKRGTKLERPEMWDVSELLAEDALLAEQEKALATTREEERAQRLARFEAIMARAAGHGDEGEAPVVYPEGGPSWMARGSNVSLGRRPSIEGAQRELGSERLLRPRWNSGAALSVYRGQKSSVFGERRADPENVRREDLSAEMAARPGLSFDGSWASVPQSEVGPGYGVEMGRGGSASAGGGGGGGRGGSDGGWADEGSEFVALDYSVSASSLFGDGGGGGSPSRPGSAASGGGGGGPVLASPSEVSIGSTAPFTPERVRCGTFSHVCLLLLTFWTHMWREITRGSRPGSAAGSPQPQQPQQQPQRPRSAGGVESSSRLYSAFTLGSRRRFGGTNFVGSEAERAIWLQERAKCSMRCVVSLTFRSIALWTHFRSDFAALV